MADPANEPHAAVCEMDEITLASEAVLARDWLSPEEETAWMYLSEQSIGP